MKNSPVQRRDFLKKAGVSLVALPFLHNLSGCAKDGVPPNIIFILVDDLGWKDVGFMGSVYYDTPNIDRLAKEGMKFTSAYAACAVCSPTRASILTGRYPVRTGITDWIRSRRSGTVIGPDRKNPEGYDDPDPKKKLLTPKNAFFMELNEITTAEILKKAGYATCHVGKWHLGPDEFLPTGQGFDENHGGDDIGHTEHYFDPFHNSGKPIPSLPPRKEGEYMTDREADEAVTFIRKNKEGPFFLNMCHYAVHLPLQAKQVLIDYYNQKDPVDGQKNPVYAAMIKSVDESTGKIIAVLEELNITDNTIVVFFSDNGGLHTVTSNAPLRMGKGYPYEGGIREAMIVKWPGVTKPGSTCGETVCSIDFFPTFCSAVGMAIPTDRPIDGTDLKPLLKKNGRLPERDLFWHFPHYWWGQHVSPYSIIRSGNWKLIKFYEDGRFELYNLKEDEGETQDRAADYPDKVSELSAKLDRWLKETGAKLPKPNPEYKK